MVPKLPGTVAPRHRWPVDDKKRRPVRLTQPQIDRFEKLLLALKLRRQVPQTTTVNRLLLRLAEERAGQLEAEHKIEGRKK